MEALKENKTSYTNKLRAPSLSSYATYEEYAAAYEAYIHSASQGNNTENAASRSGILSAYGFTSIEELSAAEADNISAMLAIEAALGLAVSDTATEDSSTGNTTFPQITSVNTTAISLISDIALSLSTAIDSAASGQPFTAGNLTSLNRLFQAASLCGYDGIAPAQLTQTLQLCADATSSSLMRDYTALVTTLPEGEVTAANTMQLKSMMDAELLSALIKSNSLLPQTEQMDYADEQYQITDLYLIPVEAFHNPDTRTTAFFCLAVAALVDILSVLFAISLRDKKPLWKKHTLLLGSLEDYAPYIYGTLPANVIHAHALADFMHYFRPSPSTESDGYMMQADMASLNGYYTLVALLCQLNLAKILPAGFADNASEILLLKARFVFWVNSVTYEAQQNGVVYE